MALTASEEALVRQLLDQQAAILSLAGNEATITSKLGATKVTLADLVAASSLADADLLLTRQGTTDKSVRADILAAYMGAELGALFAPIANPTFTGDPKAPTAAQFDNDTSLATTAFVQRALGNSRQLQQIAGATALVAEDAGKSFIVAGAGGVNITLPLVSGVPSGAKFEFINSATNSVNVVRAGADGIVVNNGAVQTSITLASGDSLVVESQVAQWVSVSGSAQLKYAGVFGSSLATSGYQKLPSGLIIQWGQLSSNSAIEGGRSVTFPIAFPNACLQVIAGMDNGTWDQKNQLNVGPQTDGKTTTGFTYYLQGLASVLGSGTIYFTYIAIGH